MNTSLHENPHVVEMAERLELDELHIVGLLWRLWSWADAQVVDGSCVNTTTRRIDKMVGVVGFCDALRAVGWLDGEDKNLVFPDFEKHNGETAKKRALGRNRNQKYRYTRKDDVEAEGLRDDACAEHDDAESVAARDAQSVTTVTRDASLEKRREEKSRKETVMGRVSQPSVLAADAEPWPATPQEVMDFAASLPLTERPKSAYALERSCIAFQDWIADPLNRRKTPDWRRKLKSWLRQDAIREAEREANISPKPMKKDDYRL